VKVFEPKHGGRGGTARRAARLTLDGEMIGEVYHAFDLLLEDDDAGHQIDRKVSGMAVRHNRLTMVLTPFRNDSLKVVDLKVNAENKRTLVDVLRAGRREGVVFKKLDAPYVPGRIENLKKATAVKVKFYSEATFAVIAWNDGKSSIQIAATSDDGISLIPVGNVTVPEKYVTQIHMAMGNGKESRALVRVRYLYATPAYVLYQPNLDPDDNMCVVRDDTNEVMRRSDLKLEGKEE
jgi:bifunctional non-homologous end joining protein LigD